MKKRLFGTIFAALICATVAISIAGCGGEKAESSLPSASSAPVTSSAEVVKTNSDFDVNDIEYELVKTVDGDRRLYELKITNNSDKPIVGMSIVYIPKEDITIKQLKNSFKDDLKSNMDKEDWDEIDWTDLYVCATNDRVIRPGETDIGGYMNVEGHSNYGSSKIIEWFEPSSIKFAYVDNGIVYTVEYNPISGDIKIKEAVNQFLKWEDAVISDRLPKPPVTDYIVDSTNKEDRVWLYLYGTNMEETLEYIEEVKAAGFDNETTENHNDEDAWFYTKDENGNKYSVRYYNDNEYMIIEYNAAE